MESGAERAKRYGKEAEKYAKLAASGPQDMMNDVHRAGHVGQPCDPGNEWHLRFETEQFVRG